MKAGDTGERDMWRGTKRVIPAFILCCGLVAGVSHSSRLAARVPISTPANDKQAVLRADHSLEQSLAKGDKMTVGQLLDGDFTWTDAAGKTRTKAQVLTMMEAGKAPTLAIEGDHGQTKQMMYGQVSVFESNAGRIHVLRVWVKRGTGWRELVYQEVQSLDAPATVTPGAGKECDNPCKSIPYEPKNEAERSVVAGYTGLETAAETHDAAGWAARVGDEFIAASSNSDQLLDKQTRKAGLERETMVGVSPTPLVSARMFDFGGTVVMTSEHRPDHGKLLRITRVWSKRDNKWVETLSYQTSIQEGAGSGK
jgi:hypothetical protein